MTMKQDPRFNLIHDEVISGRGHVQLDPVIIRLIVRGVSSVHYIENARSRGERTDLIYFTMPPVLIWRDSRVELSTGDRFQPRLSTCCDPTIPASPLLMNTVFTGDSFVLFPRRVTRFRAVPLSPGSSSRKNRAQTSNGFRIALSRQGKNLPRERIYRSSYEYERGILWNLGGNDLETMKLADAFKLMRSLLRRWAKWFRFVELLSNIVI